MTPDPQPERLRVAHLTTVDTSLQFLLLPQLLATLGVHGEATGISADGPFVQELEQRGIRHITLQGSTRKMAPLQDLRAALSLWRILRRERFDVLHTHNPKPGLYGRVVGRLVGVPNIVNTVHGLYVTEEDRLLKRAAILFLEIVAARLSDAELVQNIEDYNWLRRLPGYPKTRASLLGNGVDLARFNPGNFSRDDRAALRAAYGVREDQIAIGFVGRLVVEKGVRELACAAAGLDERFVVLAAGAHDSDKGDALTASDIAAAEQAGVRFVGLLRQIESFYAALDVFVLPSYREGVPRAAMEAAAMALPVVATAVRGCRQVVEPGITGLLVPPRDSDALRRAITALGADPGRRRTMGLSARAKATNEFNEALILERVLATYSRLTARHQGS